MKYISWNVNGLRACMTKGFAEYFASQAADFFCIQETKLQPGQIDFAPEGYHVYWNSAEKKGYSGTAIFAKHEPLSVRYDMGVEECARLIVEAMQGRKREVVMTTRGKIGLWLKLLAPSMIDRIAKRAIEKGR